MNNKVTRPDIFEMIIEVNKLFDVKYNPHFVYTQFAHETNHFKSRVFNEGNNVAGMKPSSYRKNHSGVFSKGEGQAIYDTIEDSIYDYFDYCDQTINGVHAPVKPYLNNAKKFFNEFKRRGYAEDKDYAENLEKVYKSIFPNITIIKQKAENLGFFKTPVLVTIGTAFAAFCVVIYNYFKSRNS